MSILSDKLIGCYIPYKLNNEFIKKVLQQREVYLKRKDFVKANKFNKKSHVVRLLIQLYVTHTKDVMKMLDGESYE